jgi:heme oxygenase (mycobilin-producing)
MTLAALVRFTFRPDADAVAVLDAVLATTRTFDGLERLDILVDPDDATRWTLYELWRDAETEGAYRAFRATPEGADPQLAEALAAPPTLERFTLHASS